MSYVPGRPPNVSGRPRSSEAVTLPDSVTWPAWANGHRGRAMQLDFDDAAVSPSAKEAAEVKAFCTSSHDTYRPPQSAYRSSARLAARRAPPAPWWRLAWRCLSDEIAFFVLGRLPLKYYIEARRIGFSRQTRESVTYVSRLRLRYTRKAVA